ncbi:AI-2E family transporter [Lutibaculum baratangense]|uniref:Permease n=1 Tax=Lutibaculum baratangense AMV1 TaxID=631454 RepID=V4REL8_9HYPH|nr:AI-2E family transporter [Lutibaculum baratangense]ESR24586.1 hypothetical protein N177_2420 [Lutibaculum baratangense AMV1]
MSTARQRHEPGGIARTAFVCASIGVGVAAFAYLVWQASVAILVIFGGILLATCFDALARLLGHVLPVHRKWRVISVVILLVTVVAAALAYGAQAIIAQINELASVLEDQLRQLQEQLVDLGLLSEGENATGIEGLLPDTSSIFGGATQAVLTFFGGAGNFILLLFLGLFFALDPYVYKRGLVSLFPPRSRPRASEVLHDSAHTLRMWLVGQVISMGIIFGFSLVLLLAVGMPFATLLAVQAGVLAFIPLIGPVLAGIPIILAGLSESPQMALVGLGVYLLIQALESNVIQPVVQRRTISLPPAFTLSLQLVAGVLFGLLGVALAVPLGATVMRIVQIAYVEGVHGGPWKGDTPKEAGD